MLNSRFQYPLLSDREKARSDFFGRSSIFEFLLARKKWCFYYLALVKRALRGLNDRFGHLRFEGHVKLDKDFKFETARAKPRGACVDGVYFSSSYELDFEELPLTARAQVLAVTSILRVYFADNVNIDKISLWRNEHVPVDVAERTVEVFADSFHQDLVIDQYNAQLFILLHDTADEHGPFEFLNGYKQIDHMPYYKKRNKRIPVCETQKLIGKRGDFLLFSTGSTLHRATIPSIGKSRDILSIAFFPRYTGIGTKSETLSSQL
ncbi:hypothetical protein N8500_04640 [Candidatus Puniceispirillum sp.]|nr:hypothetical protein [Candidatus Puniceispirillum sp.]